MKRGGEKLTIEGETRHREREKKKSIGHEKTQIQQ